MMQKHLHDLLSNTIHGIILNILCSTFPAVVDSCFFFPTQEVGLICVIIRLDNCFINKYVHLPYILIHCIHMYVFIYDSLKISGYIIITPETETAVSQKHEASPITALRHSVPS